MPSKCVIKVASLAWPLNFLSNMSIFYVLFLQCAAIRHKNPSQYLSPLYFDYNEGINENPRYEPLSLRQWIFWKKVLSRASLAMASLCGLNAGHIWSNYLTRKQLSVILKGEVFQSSNLLNPVVALPLCLKKALLHNAAKEGRRHYMRRRAELGQLPCSLVCQRIGRTYLWATSVSSKYYLVALEFRWTTEAPCARFEGGVAIKVRVLYWHFLSSVCFKFWNHPGDVFREHFFLMQNF